SKVLLAFDVSRSMHEADDVSADAAEASTRPGRLDKVIDLLTANRDAEGKPVRSFLERLQDKSPVICYRFGEAADDETVEFSGGKTWTREQWNAWLRPDPQDIKVKPSITKEDEKASYLLARRTLYDKLLNATDVGGSVLQAFEREAGGPIQAVIV